MNNDMTNNLTNDLTNIKKIIIEKPQKNKLRQNEIKKINCEKEIKMRVETKTWGLNDNDLSHETQLNILINGDIMNGNNNNNNNKYIQKIISHIKNKLYSYRQQDIIKKKLNEEKFVSFEETIELLKKSNLKCCYCSNEVYILYERVREMKQWTLDRINNDIGHNNENLVISCLECNLKRRRTNKDAFMFTKNMVIIKEK
jgi:hypothetical protein